MFWSDWHLMNNAPYTIRISYHHCINDGIVLGVGQVLRHIISEIEKGKRCLEFSWQKLSDVLKSDDSDRIWGHLIYCCLNIPLLEGSDRMDMLLLNTVLTQVWWKSELLQPASLLRLPPDTFADEHCRLASKKLGNDAHFIIHLPALRQQQKKHDPRKFTSYHIYHLWWVTDISQKKDKVKFLKKATKHIYAARSELLVWDIWALLIKLKL